MLGGSNVHRLAGRSILVIEDEPLIALEVAHCLTEAGAHVIKVHTGVEAAPLAEKADVAAAIVDHTLADGDSQAICERLIARGIPFVIYSGYTKFDGACASGVRLSKPATGAQIVDTVAGLLAG